MSVVTILPECKTQLKVTDTPVSQKSSRTSTKSLDSMFSSGSSKFSGLNRRKMGHHRYRDRGAALIPAVSEVKQRVMSAKVLRVKHLQNQIAEAHQRINELTIENRLLQSLHKRQDSALSKYENTNAELPKLLHAHAEEVRMWQTRARNLQRVNKELMSKLKQNDAINLTLTDQNKHLMSLSKEKNLEEREKLQERVRDLESRLIEKDNDMKLLARRLQLEMKAHRTDVQMEQAKFRELVSKIEFAEFLHDEKRLQKSTQLMRPIARFKSPQRLTSKSASSLSFGNEKNALILPPCEGQESIVGKRENHETSSSPRSRTKKMQIQNGNNNEMILSTKNNREKLKNGSTIIGHKVSSHHDDDEIKITLLDGNGANHARPKKLIHSQKPKIFSKIQPLQLSNVNKETETTKNGNYSDSSTVKGDGDSPKNDLLEHKLNIDDLETKLKCDKFQCDETSSSSSSLTLTSPDICTTTRSRRTFDKLPGHSMEKNDHDLSSFSRQIREGNVRRESLLDELCDAIVESKPIQRIAPQLQNGHTKVAKDPQEIKKVNGLDPKKKSNLLQVLKNIDDES